MKYMKLSYTLFGARGSWSQAGLNVSSGLPNNGPVTVDHQINRTYSVNTHLWYTSKTSAETHLEKKQKNFWFFWRRDYTN